ncbi:PfkB family carbohydrate kinase [Nocardioides sp. BP30]|uniref:PfkB family carbohydrate kinase n=1 Tax=Nocardioides sp. BP30 TaxID=3036374 RepID=UPI0024686CFC|nr:PfkB family carbohydrate kinase [Nocardioides sp. BP30]WGL51093.1 PfkB family carbohydrate kinase [Nocardioides sp. BP30]
MPDPDRDRLSIDVVVLGEVLVEVSSTGPLVDGAATRLGFSGDALNAAAAAAAAGARTALIAKVPSDELGDALVARAGALGIDTGWIVRSEGQHGLYLSHADPEGRREFTYVRTGSLGSQLSVADLDDALLQQAGVVLASGITCAVSTSAADAVRHAARLARRFVYDPNFRPRLTDRTAAAAMLRELAPLAEVIVPSWPTETQQLLDLTGAGAEAADTPMVGALAALGRLGARSIVMTCGADGAQLWDAERGTRHVPPTPAPAVVDQTGAGDCFGGTLAGRLALGDDLETAARLAGAAAALSVQGQGGTGFIPTLAQTRAALETHHPEAVS